MKKFTREEREINEELKEEGFGLYMTATEVAKAIGKTHPQQGRDFMEGCAEWRFGNKSRVTYARADVVRQMALCKVN